MYACLKNLYLAKLLLKHTDNILLYSFTSLLLLHIIFICALFLFFKRHCGKGTKAQVRHIFHSVHI